MVTAASTPKDKLVAYALELGFDSCRIATATTPPHAKQFRSWLADGGAGEMDWMERGAEKRCDPERIVPGVRSIVIVGLNYWQGKDDRLAGTGTIARYAWGDDYHDLVLAQLGRLCGFLDEIRRLLQCY